ncbi:MAG: hypothetical protein ACRD4T_00170 [Candidatus Acidiferrales bacterium]
MPRVPLLEVPQVETRALPTPYERTASDTGLGDLAAGLQRLGAGLERRRLREEQEQAQERKAEEARQAKHQEALARANATAASDALNELKHGSQTGLYGDKGQGGFLATRGQDAAKASEVSLAEMQKRAEALSRRLANDEQRGIFRQHAQGVLLGFRQDVDRHVSTQQRAAEQASLEGAKQLALSSVAHRFGDELAVERESRAVEDRLVAFSLSPEDAARDVAEWRRSVVKTRMGALLEAKDWQGAEALYGKAKELLGPEGARIEKDIRAVRRDGEADRLAISAVESAIDDDGRVDADRALAGVDVVTEGDTDIRDEARRRAQQRIMVAERAYDAETERLSKEAHAAYNRGGWNGVPGPLKDALNERNPGLYGRLRDDSDRRYRQRRGAAVDARREQADRDRDARNEFNALSPSERAETDLDAFLAGRGVGKVGASAIKVDQRKAIDSVVKGEAQSETEFLRQARAASLGEGLKGKATAKEFNAGATLRYQQFIEEKKRAPNSTEAKELIADLVLERVTEEGTFFDTKKRGYQMALEGAKAQAAPKQPSAPARTGGPTPTGLRKRVKGVLWEEMSDGTARKVEGP